MLIATYSHDYGGQRFQLPIDFDDDFQREIIELGLRVSFAMAQENESSAAARPFILSDRFAQAAQ
jgi:hypothetical protein